MKRINTAFASDPSPQQPWTVKSLDFVQDNLDETTNELIRGFITAIFGSYSSGTPYVLYGCEVTGSGPYNVTVGKIFYNGFIYDTTAITGSVNPIKYIVEQYQYTLADPLTFSDNVGRNVHDIFRMKAVDQVLAGNFAASDFVSIIPSWKTWTPTLSARDSGGNVVIGGFTATTVVSLYMYKDNTLKLELAFTNIVTLSNSRSLEISLPFPPPTSQTAIGNSTCMYDNGTTPQLGIINCFLNSVGFGDGLTIRRITATDFGAFTGGSAKFSITISLA